METGRTKRGSVCRNVCLSVLCFFTQLWMEISGLCVCVCVCVCRTNRAGGFEVMQWGRNFADDTRECWTSTTADPDYFDIPCAISWENEFFQDFHEDGRVQELISHKPLSIKLSTEHKQVLWLVLIRIMLSFLSPLRCPFTKPPIHSLFSFPELHP